MKNGQDISMLTELTPEEASSICGGGVPLAVAGTIAAGAWAWSSIPGNGIYIDPDGNPTTTPNLVVGDFNYRSTEWKDVKWDVRGGGKTIVKGYGNTPSWLADAVKKQFGFNA